MNIWNLLEHILRESKQYRGNSGLTFDDLEKLVASIAKSGKISGGGLDPAGGAFDCEYDFRPEIWGKWFPSISTALGMASTERDQQYPGVPYGGTVMKRNYGGRVTYQPGNAKSDHERLPSAMDRYDVLMRGEVTTSTRLDKKTRSAQEVSKGVLHRVAYAPSMGSSEERSARLMDLMSGKSASALSRRPQPARPGRVPDPTKQDPDSDDPYWVDKVRHSSPDVPRVGGRMGMGQKQQRGDDDQTHTFSGTGSGNDSFKSKLAKHDAQYKPKGAQAHRPVDPENDDGALFPKKKK